MPIRNGRWVSWESLATPPDEPVVILPGDPEPESVKATVTNRTTEDAVAAIADATGVYVDVPAEDESIENEAADTTTEDEDTE